MDEEVLLLEEQLAAAHADIERLQTALSEAEARAATGESALTDLRRQLAAAGERETATAAEVEALRQAVAAADARGASAAARYREAVLAHEPSLPADLVAGETVEDVDAAVERARQTVAQVRQRIEQEAASQRVPAGAPVRSAPDLSDLSPSEKIRLGLQR